MRVKIGALPFAQLAGMFDRLLEARDFRTHLVVTPLHRRHAVAVRSVHRALLLERRLGRAQLGELGLQRELALAQRRVVHLRAAIEVAQLERDELRGQAALAVFQRLVAPRGGGLALQVADLLLDLVAQVLQPLEVLARLADAHLGFLAALLVTRDAGGLLDKGAHVFAAGVDHAGDHALLDDRVAARPKAGAEEQVGDVLAAAAHAVDEVGRGAVAGHLALERNLRVARVRAADLAVGVVEHQLDGGRTDRLARARAVEHDVRHVVAAQVLGGQLAHHPAHRVDDVGFAAAVRADDTGEIAGEADLCGIYEGFEAGEPDLGQPHLEESSAASQPPRMV